MSGDRLLNACRGQPVDVTPVWFMRQAGRYLPEYRAIREHHSILEICHDPTLAAEVSLQPVTRFEPDAAIVFADILLPFEPWGLGLSFHPGEGPVLDHPIRTADHVEGLRVLDPHTDLGFVLETVRLVSQELGHRVPVIGFAGAPFTLASYAIEGGASRQFIETKRFMYGQPEAWHALLSTLAATVGQFLAAQAKAGAQVLQLFDSWVGCLAPSDYRRFVLPHSRQALTLAAAAGTPTIHFGTCTATLLDAMADAGADVISVDWRIPLDRAWRHFPDRAIQGNLDPAALLAPAPELRTQVHDVLARAARRPGHIFNLGHGVLPQTSPDHVRATIDLVREYRP